MYDIKCEDLQTLSLQDMVRRRAPCSTASHVCTPSLKEQSTYSKRYLNVRQLSLTKSMLLMAELMTEVKVKLHSFAKD
jgi:hypothetical protein